MGVTKIDHSPTIADFVLKDSMDKNRCIIPEDCQIQIRLLVSPSRLQYLKEVENLETGHYFITLHIL